MKIWLLSDIHLEFSDWAPPKKRPAHDVVVIAGDLVPNMETGVEWIVEHGLNAKPVIYIAGNHEHYGQSKSVNLVRGTAAAAAHENIHVLQDQEVIINGVRFLACTLWTDYNLFGPAQQRDVMKIAHRLMNDHNRIGSGVMSIGPVGDDPYERNWMPYDALKEHTGSALWLQARLLEKHNGSTVVVTHHAPHAVSLEGKRFPYPELRACYASDMSRLFPMVDLWCHGHIHPRCQDYVVDGCRIVSNVRGYQDYRNQQDTGFKPSRTIDLDAWMRKKAKAAAAAQRKELADGAQVT